MERCRTLGLRYTEITLGHLLFKRYLRGLSFFISIQLSIYPSIYLYIYLIIYLFSFIHIYLAIYIGLITYLSTTIKLSICLSLFVNYCQSINLSIFFEHLSALLFNYLPFLSSTYIFIYLHLFNYLFK